MLIYLSLWSAGEACLYEWQIPFVVLSQDIDFHVGGPLQQTDTDGMLPLRAQSNTRWQCASVAAGHLPGCLGSSLSVHLGLSHKNFYRVAELSKSLSPRSHKAYVKKVTQCTE